MGTNLLGEENSGFNKSLLVAIDQGLLPLGDLGRAAFFRFVETRHRTKRRDIPKNLLRLQSALTVLFGTGGRILESLIGRAFYSELGLKFEAKGNWRLSDYVQYAKQTIAESPEKREAKEKHFEAVLLLRLILRSEKSAQLLVLLRNHPKTEWTTAEIARKISTSKEETRELTRELVKLDLMVEKDVDEKLVYVFNVKRDDELQKLMAMGLEGYEKPSSEFQLLDEFEGRDLPKGKERMLREAFGDELAEAIITTMEDRARATVKALGALEPTPVRLREGSDVFQTKKAPREARLQKAALRIREKDVEPRTSSVRSATRADVILVDASNVAWYNRNRGASESPLLSQITSIVDKLLQEGYVQERKDVKVLADATLRHIIDDRESFERMISTREIEQVPSGTSADAFLLELLMDVGAEGKKVLLVTNDKMVEPIRTHAKKHNTNPGELGREVRNRSIRFLFTEVGNQKKLYLSAQGAPRDEKPS